MCDLVRILTYCMLIATTFTLSRLGNDTLDSFFYNTIAFWIRDVLFLLSTLIILFFDRKTKWKYINIFSLLLIIVALVMKLSGSTYPIWMSWFLSYYIFLVRGLQLSLYEVEIPNDKK